MTSFDTWYDAAKTERYLHHQPAKDVQSNGRPFVPSALRFKLRDLILVKITITEISGGRGKTRTGLSKSGHNWPVYMLFIRKFEPHFLEHSILAPND